MKFRNFLFIALALSCFLGWVRADSPLPPMSYTKVTKNNKYIFVMLAYRTSYDPENLKEKYPSSGLYPNDGSNVPLWKFSGFAPGVNVSSDGRHLITGGPWPQIGDKGETEAVVFYRDGKELKSYRIKDLVPKPEAMPQSVSHYIWCEKWEFDDEKGRLEIKTIAGEKSPSRTYLFDVTSGEIIERKK